MADENFPVGFIELSKINSGALILKNSKNKILIPLFFIIFCFLIYSNFPLLVTIFVLPFSILLLLVFLIDFLRKEFILNSIAINLGHPWIEEEHDIDVAEVGFRTLDGWNILPSKGRVKNTLEINELLIEDGSTEVILLMSEINFMAALFSGNKAVKIEVIKWLNLALAIRDAQNLVEDDIEKARLREDDDDFDVERIWPETNPGDLNVKPGAIFRKLSKPKK